MNATASDHLGAAASSVQAEQARASAARLGGRETEASLAVGNQGPVTPAEVMPTLFEPFRRGASPDHLPRGLGLGLYIAKQIVLAHGGTIEVDSTTERGTVFTVHLPRTGRAIRADGTRGGLRRLDGDVS